MNRIIFVAAIALVPAAALADVPDSAIVRCAGIVADAERLACFDAIADGVAAAASVSQQRRVEAAAAERKAAEEARIAAERAAAEAEARKVREFGAETTAIRDELSDGKISGLAAKVSEVFTDRYGMYLLLLDNGQLWKQVDGKLLIVRVGDDVELERGALGSYKMKIPRQKRSVAAKRLR